MLFNDCGGFITNAYSYKKAFQSMKAHPTTFNHPSEAQQLAGIGPKLCDRLTDKLKAYCVANGLPIPEKGRSKKSQSSAKPDEDEPEATENAADEPPKKKRKQKEYVPALRSGAYAIIMALSELDQEGMQALSKPDLITRAQPFSDSSFTAPSDPTKYFTAWKSMSTLETKELVCTKGHPTKRYYLSDEGWSVALRMREKVNGNNPWTKAKSDQSKAVSKSTSTKPSSSRNAQNRASVDVSDLSSSPEPETEPNLAATPLRKLIPIRDSGASGRRASLPSHPTSDPIVVEPGTFEVKMLLDTREIRTTTDRDYIANELKKQGVVAEIRSLPLGDVLWTAKLKPAYASAFQYKNAGDDDEGSTEIVLEHVLERKRLDDLVYSIRDGRFHEQKFRLKKSGMRHVTYLVEDYSMSAERVERVADSLESAIASMQMVNDIFVKQTAKMDDTIKYLAHITKSLKEMYEGKQLHVLRSETLDVATYLATLGSLRVESPSAAFCITFSAFCSLCDKSNSLTLRDVYLKMLMCTRGITGDKAIEIQKIWSTPNALIEAYAKLGQNQAAKDAMISDQLSNMIDRKKIAKTLSAKVAEVWSS